jgi:hypothetical protein
VVNHLRENPMMVEPYKSVGKVILLVNRYPDVAFAGGRTGWLACVPLIPHLVRIDPLKVLRRSVAPKQHPPLINKQPSYKVLIH